jgi:hypothetical protein
MIVRVHIERIVVDGPLPGSSADLQAGVAGELTRILATREVPLGITSSASVATARGGDLPAGAWSSVEGLSDGIARSIVGGIAS